MPIDAGTVASIVGSAVTLISAVTGAFVHLVRRIDKLRQEANENYLKYETRIKALEVHDQTLWSIYVDDAIREARRLKLTRRTSPDQPTKKWEEMIPHELREAVNSEIARLGVYRSSTEVVSYIWSKYVQEFLAVLDSEGTLSTEAIIGTLKVLVDRFKDQEPLTEAMLKDEQGFYTEKGLKKLLFDSRMLNYDEFVCDKLLLFETRKQRTWLVATNRQLFHLLDDEETRKGKRVIQGSQPLSASMTVRAYLSWRQNPVIDIGKRKQWLYSRRLHPNPDNLVKKVRTMISEALTRQ